MRASVAGNGRWENTRECRSCGHRDRVEFLSFGNMPLPNRLLTQAQLGEDEPRFPLTVVFCPECSLVQLRETVDPELLFSSDYPYFASVSDAWVRHCRENALELVQSRHLNRSSFVVEIASNDGYLLRNYVERGIPVLGIDPASGPAAVARRSGVPTREEFFGRDLAQSLAAEGIRADVIHANNVLAHVADLRGVVEGLRILLADDGVAVIEAPYVRDLIDHREFDTIYHEHVCYFSVTAVSRLFERCGLSLVDVRRVPTHGGSLRMYVQRTGRPSPAVQHLLQEEHSQGLDRLDYYRHFAETVRATQESFRHLLEGLKNQGKRIAGYAVAAKGTILLNSSGVGADVIDYLVDRSPHKQGKYMPGVQLPVYDPARLLESPVPDYVVLLAWNFKDEIVHQQRAYSATGGRFIVPIPHPQIVDEVLSV